ncbi:inositol hexakisphosphate and diphosphoinositol-pentakisphosphate kinase 1 isoform X8 [Canis lupus baileyi]|uniref:inositol hexakisphosphate and diphosphoinositol-pentakisphosphate kinase 1 isoform X5 n=1 Tax=Canis lupus familiaris TaxID=9615 RepID=UPI0003AE3025|nr:inositol hexakisphosphate and diphosphoinositol-pentakisphosphate kinase 1 isoform X5 [Canis lupus familiaris]XP_038317014.1 inositol hexakisphosphate and diphosphoinositol-pentakisphosphate kinase 1 isoform X5 [Canis lupus familiaris]XP_038436156.1 inositol hexakisphosphate and diphosphoinositol-pentakisphosphate kinase 1 isoform X5 [Canis lupus familiaris]XP_048960221.1 inositol hexakisphosphate and diphosphoinositol-pentakisphosphate kinase 1 isoform X8 [Canis lupus dingo]|eukprot:XP_005638405.1 inositol hexakisphosphate and diphosphoinositol-pentakisphosphate kinase 1 isoform X7 [Canis lupus familiaris]
MWSLPASEGESATAHFFLGAGDEGLGTRGIGMRTEESDNELLEDEEDEVPPEPQIIVGICAMTKKSKSKPMTQILERLCRFDYLTVIILGEDVILNEPVENWPSCHCLISFHSKGFPLDKAVAYSKLRNPFLINDLAMQYYIQDRREVYRILQEEGIDLPRYAVLNRDPARPEECNLIEGEDQVEVNGAVFPKPFVEKPVSAEDHNVYIYYPSSAGGGSQRLFRKIGSRSSVYSPESSVRKTGSYIYEEFMPTDGTDVKVYTVGPDYAHAEARKSPALDGKVERDSEGKEIRYPVMLTAMEKLVARKVCVAFKQTVCGFDLLRANGHSFVCDVNGFSFVKNSMKYYDDCAKILGNTIMRELAPQFQIPWSIPTEAEDIPIVPTTSGTMMELRCVIAIIRHGDRTPKQKMKMEVTHPRFFSLFEKHGGYKTGKLKLKRPEQLQEVLDITRLLLAELEKEPGGEIEEKTGKLEQLKSVLEMYGHFSGINRKVQLTYYPHGVKATNEGQDPQREALAPSLLLVLKWGGELTPAGRVQAEELGRAFRCMYPGGQGDYAGFPGCGLLRLHSTFRHDLKIYASDEGRVQMTAAAFAKGLLALEGELTPILVQMVKSANMNGLLDSDGDSLSSCQHRVKARLHHILQQDAPFGPEDYDQLAPTGSTSLLNSMAVIQNPVKVCDQVFALIENLTHQIRERMQDPKSVDLQLYHSETLELMLQRWSKLERDFRQKSGRYDISKIPDIYDCVKYDVQHNGSLGLQGTAELLRLSKALADVVIPQEYGISREEKLEIAVGFCLPLLRKILLDLQRTHEDESVNKLHPLYSRGVLSPGRHVRTRLYFTSESHVHSLLSVFRYGGLLDETQDAQWQRALAYLSAISELNYMTQIVIMLYEDNTRDPLSEERFHVELHFSPGVKGVEEEGSAPTGCGFRPASSENEEMKTDQGSMENLCPGKASDEPDRALQTSPQPLEGPGLPRRSPLIRNRKAGSMEVLSETSSSRPGSYRLFSSARPPTEMKQSGLGSQCTGLFSTTVLGGSSSAPNLQDYARSHGKKLPPASLKHRDELLFVPAVKRFSVSFAKHPTNGFEGCSMVPTIYPLETLHNALSLRQVSEFLSRVCQRHTDAQAQASAALFDSMHSNQASDSPFSPPRTLHSPTLQLRQRSEKPPWYSSGPSSTVSSAGPSSPTAVDGNCPFGFSDQPSVSSHMIEEHQGLGMLPRNGEQELPIEGVQEPFEPSQSSQEPPVETSQPCQEVVEEISQPCQEVPDISQPCQDIPEEVSQPCQEVPDIGQPCQENHDSVNQICQEVPQIHQPCQKASQLCQKMSEDACQLCQKNPEKVSQPSLDVPVEVGRLAHGFPVGVRDLVQEIHVEVGRPAQETPEEFSQPCQEFFVEVGRLAQEASAINLLSQDIPEVDKPSQEFPGEDDLQVQEVPEINQQSWVVPEVIDQLPGEDIPQAQYLSSDPNPQSQSLAHDQYSPLPPATCD